MKVGLVFFSYTTVCSLVFLFIARNWPNLIRFWCEKEKNFLKHPYKVKFKLSMKIKVVASIVLTLAFLEHALFLTNEIYSYSMKIKNCNCSKELTLSNFLDHQFNFIFRRINFSLPYGIFVEIFNFSLTLSWNYMELFVMMISIGLVTRFNQINTRIVETTKKVRTCFLFLRFAHYFIVVAMVASYRVLLQSQSLSVNQRGSRFVLTMFFSVNSLRKLITNFVFSSFFQILTIYISFATNFLTFGRE